MLCDGVHRWTHLAAEGQGVHARGRLEIVQGDVGAVAAGTARGKGHDARRVVRVDSRAARVLSTALIAWDCDSAIDACVMTMAFVEAAALAVVRACWATAALMLLLTVVVRACS